MRRLTILHNLDNSNIGGIQEMIFRLYKYSEHQHDFWAADGTMAPEMRSAGMVLWPGGPPPEAHYDVLVGHGVGGWSYDAGFRWAKERGMKTVEVMHSNARSLTDPSLVDAFVSLSHIADSQNQHMPNRAVIYGPVPTSSFWLEDKPEYIGRLSRLAYEKDPQSFLEIAQRFPGERFIIAGDGSMRGWLEGLGVPNVTFAGMVRDHPDFYKKLKLFVFPTRDECCCMSVAMAQAAEVPVICQDIPALRETTGGKAIFATTFDDFCNKIRYALDHPDEMRAMGQEGREWSRDHFGLEATVGRWDGLISALVV